jgi:hypothetical protein
MAAVIVVVTLEAKTKMIESVGDVCDKNLNGHTSD